MDNFISIKMLAFMLLITSSCIIESSEQKLRMNVDLYVDRFRETFSSIRDADIRSENRQRCISFGFQDKKSLGMVEVRPLYYDSRYTDLMTRRSAVLSQQDWVLLVPTNVINMNKKEMVEDNTIDSTFRTIGNAFKASTNCYNSTIGTLKYNDSEFYKGIAGLLAYNPDFFQKATNAYAHPRFIPAAWIIDKKIGDRFTLQAHGCEIEYTIKSLPKDDWARTSFKILSWKKYIQECASDNAGLIKVFAVLFAVKMLFWR